MCLPYSGIAYFTSRDRVVYVQTTFGEKGPVRRTLDQVEEHLRKSGFFVRCHKSYLVNRDCCLELNKSDKTLVLKHGHRVPVSRAYWDAVSEQLLPKT